MLRFSTEHQGAKHDNGPKPKSHKGTWPSWPWISGLVLSMVEIDGNGSLLEKNAALYTMAIGSVSTGTVLWISLVGCKSVHGICAVSCRCTASIWKCCTSEKINKFNQMQEDVLKLAIRRNRTYRGNDDYTVVAVFKQLRHNNSQTNKTPRDTPSMQKESHGNSEWIMLVPTPFDNIWIEAETWNTMCLTLDLSIFQFRLLYYLKDGCQ